MHEPMTVTEAHRALTEVAEARGRADGFVEALSRRSSGDADADEDGSTWFAVDVSELRAHFSASTIDEVSTSYERGWLQGWRDYNETQPGNGE